MKRDPRRLLLEALAEARRARVEVRRAIARLRGREEARDLLHLLSVADTVLDIVTVRLQVILSSRLYFREYLQVPLALVRELSRRGAGLPPSLVEALTYLESALESAASMLPESGVRLGREDAGREAERIIAEAEREAKRRRASSEPQGQ